MVFENTKKTGERHGRLSKSGVAVYRHD